MKTDPHEFDFFDLDSNRLDGEWLNQPRLYHENALKLADARAELERAKSHRDVVAAELDREIRLDPAAFDIAGKVTEGAITNTILLQKRHRLAEEQVIQAKHTVDVLVAVVEALDHRKKALENLVQLEARDYFSAPRAPVGSGGKAVKERQADKAFGARKKDKETA